MNLDDIDDFDPAAFGFSGFGGAKSKGKAASTAKAKHAPAAATTTTTAKALSPVQKNVQAAEEPAAASLTGPDSSIRSTGDDAEASSSMPGPSSLSLRNNGGGRKDPREDDDEQQEEEDDDDDHDDTQDDSDYFPVSHEAIMKDHTKAVTALAIDPAGARLVTGGYDYDVKMWDFGGMQADFRPFRSMEPYENYHVHDVAWDATGSNYIVACGLLTPKMYDRDGTLIGEFAKGDMFLRDLKNTVGHVGPLTSVCWHPTDPTRFLTSSMDGTIRIWDSGERFKSKTTIVVKSKERGGRTKVTKALWSSDGKWIAAACTDGTINVWSTNSNYARPNYTAESAHEKGTETSGLTFSLDNRTLLSRGGDGTVKLWDIRAMKKPRAVATDLPAVYPETNVVFSPDEQYVLTGTAGRNSGSSTEENETAKKEARIQDGGKIVVMKKDTLEVVKQFSVTKGSVIRLAWPSRINQIFASTSTGEVHVLYSPTSSEKGAVLAASRAPRRRRELDEQFDPASMPIITPHALPMFKEANPYEVGDAGVATKRKRENVRNNAVKSHKPDVPVRGPGHGGRVGEAANKYLVRDQIDTRSEDPRAALLKYANDADNVNKVFDTRQYDEEAQQDQPGYGKGQQRSK